MQNSMTQDTVVHNFLVIAEITKNLALELRDAEDFDTFEAAKVEKMIVTTKDYDQKL